MQNTMGTLVYSGSRLLCIGTMISGLMGAMHGRVANAMDHDPLQKELATSHQGNEGVETYSKERLAKIKLYKERKLLTEQLDRQAKKLMNRDIDVFRKVLGTDGIETFVKIYLIPESYWQVDSIDKLRHLAAYRFLEQQGYDTRLGVARRHEGDHYVYYIKEKNQTISMTSSEALLVALVNVLLELMYKLDDMIMYDTDAQMYRISD